VPPVNDQPAPSTGPTSPWLLLPLLLSLVLAGLLVGSRPHRQPALVSPPMVETARTNLVRFQNLWCEIGHTNPFTGVMLEYYPGGLRMSRSVIAHGLLNGLSQGWFTNGQMQIQETYHDNLSDGLRTKWYPNGRKLSEATIVHGQIEGIFRRWHEDGSLAEEIPMHNGHQEGLGRAYYASGCLAGQVEVRAGRVVDQQTWPDGARKAL